MVEREVTAGYAAKIEDLPVCVVPRSGFESVIDRLELSNHSFVLYLSFSSGISNPCPEGSALVAVVYS